MRQIFQSAPRAWQRVPVLVLVILLHTVPFAFVHAQSAAAGRTIALGETVLGAVTADDIAPSYFFEIDAPLTVRFILETPDPAFAPIVLLVRARDTSVLATAITDRETDSGPARAAADFALGEAGSYFLQVQAPGSQGGTFTLQLLDPAAPTPTATQAAPPTDAPTQRPEPAAPITLPDGAALSGVVNAGSRVLVYAVEAADAARVLFISTRAEMPVAFTLIRGTRTAVVSVPRPAPSIVGMAASVSLAAFVLEPGDLYTVEAQFTGGETDTRFAAFSLVTYPAPPALAETWLSGTLSGDGAAVGAAAPTAEAQAAPTAQPSTTPAPAFAPSDVDVVMRWTGTYWMLVNSSGAFLDIHDLAFEGLGRRADARYWEQTGTIDIYALPPGACVGLRPLAHAAEPPPLVAGCRSLAAWWASDAAAFWLAATTPDGPGTFAVFYNGQPLATCFTESGSCALDMPNA
jgi:hypothetical protein